MIYNFPYGVPNSNLIHMNLISGKSKTPLSKSMIRIGEPVFNNSYTPLYYVIDVVRSIVWKI